MSKRKRRPPIPFVGTIVNPEIEIQRLIKKRYLEKVKALQKDICPKCTLSVKGKCDWKILPVTSSGETCPYYNTKIENVCLSA